MPASSICACCPGHRTPHINEAWSCLDIFGKNLKDTKSAEVYFKSAWEVEPKIPTVNIWSVEAGVKSGETDTNNSSARSIYMMAVSDSWNQHQTKAVSG